MLYEHTHWWKDLTEDQIQQLRDNTTVNCMCEKWMEKAFWDMPLDHLDVVGGWLGTYGDDGGSPRLTYCLKKYAELKWPNDSGQPERGTKR